ncbi:hypothetical protein E2R60_26700 [Paenibacillus dendritiformis]|uniref:hypothetical protein n=1 Tax=Paenibacillus dendritiformis TaxID=130049 RepID=UPI00105986A0|nr:hypothetical protein [Paenibacillus dendritiformis]TDL48491.1 hypothetical protein E2R60_26700 [Paenibacillus dendritiformis]
MEQWNLKSIIQFINEIKRNNGLRYCNYYHQELQGERFLVSHTTRSICFFEQEDGFYRGYFASADMDDLSSLLSSLELESPVVIAIVSKTQNSELTEVIQRSGFGQYSIYRRMVNRDFQKFEPNEGITYAELGQVKEILELLKETFNPYTDYLPNAALLEQLIAEKQIIINEEDGRCKGLFIYRREGIKYNFNYMVNKSINPVSFMYSMQNFYAHLKNAGLQHGYLWVDSNNVKVIKLHEKFGWKFDGLQDAFYIKGGK